MKTPPASKEEKSPKYCPKCGSLKRAKGKLCTFCANKRKTKP